MIKKIIYTIFFVILWFTTLVSTNAEYTKYQDINLSYKIEKLVDNKLDSYYNKISSKSLEDQSSKLRTIIVKIEVIKDKYYGNIHDVLVYIQNEIYKKLIEINLQLIYKDSGISYSYSYTIIGTYNYGNYEGKINIDNDYPRKPPFTVELNSDDFAFVTLTDEDGNFFFRNIPNHDYILNIKNGEELLGSGELKFNGQGYNALEIDMKTFTISTGDDDYNPLEDCEIDNSCDEIDGGDRPMEYGDFSGILLVDDDYLEGMPFTVQLKADGKIITTFTDRNGKFSFTDIQNLDYKLQVRFNEVLLVDQQLEFQGNGYGNIYLNADIRYDKLYGPISNEYEPNGEFDKAERITSHTIIKGQIDSEGFTKGDLYKFTITEKGKLYIKMARYGSSTYTNLVLYDINGNLIKSITNGLGGGTDDFYLESNLESGDYYIGISGTDSNDKYAIVTYFISF